MIHNHKIWVLTVEYVLVRTILIFVIFEFTINQFKIQFLITKSKHITDRVGRRGAQRRDGRRGETGQGGAERGGARRKGGRGDWTATIGCARDGGESMR